MRSHMVNRALCLSRSTPARPGRLVISIGFILVAPLWLMIVMDSGQWLESREPEAPGDPEARSTLVAPFDWPHAWKTICLQYPSTRSIGRHSNPATFRTSA